MWNDESPVATDDEAPETTEFMAPHDRTSDAWQAPEPVDWDAYNAPAHQMAPSQLTRWIAPGQGTRAYLADYARETLSEDQSEATITALLDLGVSLSVPGDPLSRDAVIQIVAQALMDMS